MSPELGAPTRDETHGMPEEGAHPARGPPWSPAALSFHRPPAPSHVRPLGLQTVWSRSSPRRARAAGDVSGGQAQGSGGSPTQDSRPPHCLGPHRECSDSPALVRTWGQHWGARGGPPPPTPHPQSPALSQCSLDQVSLCTLPSRPARIAGLKVAEL